MAIQRRPHGHGLRNSFVRASGWRLKLLDRFDALTHGDGTFEVGEQLATIRSHSKYPMIRFCNVKVAAKPRGRRRNQHVTRRSQRHWPDTGKNCRTDSLDEEICGLTQALLTPNVLQPALPMRRQASVRKKEDSSWIFLAYCVRQKPFRTLGYDKPSSWTMVTEATAGIHCAFEMGISKHIEKDGMQIPGTSIWNYS